MEYKTKAIISFVCFILISLIIYIVGIPNFDRYQDSIIFLTVFGILSLFLTVYFISLEYPKKRKMILMIIGVIALVTSIIIFWVILCSEFFIFFYPLSPILTLIFIMIITILPPVLIAHFSKKIETTKYAFGGVLIFFLMYLILDIIVEKIRYVVEYFTYYNLNSLIEATIINTTLSFLILFSHISLIILIGINLYLNKKQVSESKKKKILLIWTPIILTSLLLLFYGVLTLIDF
ncbi:MAG: hypothetical protein WC533_00720 [Candidatus Pacearchaeota archaeon]